MANISNHSAFNANAPDASGVRPYIAYGNILDQKRYIYASQFVGGKAVLDCACGNGWGTFLMSNAGAESVLGIDISEDAVASAGQYFSHPKATFICGTLADISSNASYDVITSFETLEHVEDAEEFLGELKRLAHANTILLLSTPNGLAFKEEMENPHNPYHLKEFSRQELEDMFASTGWKVTEYRGQHQMPLESSEISNYRKFIKRHWKAAKFISRFSLLAKFIISPLVKLGFIDLVDPAHSGHCNPTVVLENHEPAYHYFCLRIG